LFGPIDPRLWGPWPAAWPAEQPYQRNQQRQARTNVILLQGTPPCVPCNGQGCDKQVNSRSECLETMEPERVLREALAILECAEAPQAMTSLR
jgi:heptosyltransferase III